MEALCNLITWLDGYANLSCVDPLRIEKAVRLCGKDVKAIWERTKEDVYAIGKLPIESEKVVRWAKIVNASKFLFFGFAMLAMGLFILASQAAPRFFSKASNSILLVAIIAVLFNSDIIVYIYSSRRLSLEVKEFFEGSEDKAKLERKRVKDAAQALINKLASRIKSMETEPSEYQFTLYDSGYANVRVTKEKGLLKATVNVGNR